MIVLTRVDHRLLHGQVAMSWTSILNADCILIANDELVSNELKKTTMKLAKPNNVKLVIKSIEDSIKAINSGVTDKYKLFIVVESIKDAKRLVEQIPAIKQINLGGTKAKDGTRAISKAINVLPEEESMIKDMIKNGIEVEIRQLPTDKKMLAKKVL